MPAEPGPARPAEVVPGPASGATAELRAAQRLLTSARAALDGTSGLPPRRRTRAAALFGRTALELIVIGSLAAAGHDLARANMRSRLICLTRLVDETAGRAAAVAWAGLSRSCHEHAYELSPTWAEVTHLLGLVEGVARRVGQPVGTRTP